MASDANKRHPWLYVTGNANNTVVIYDLAKSGFPQIGAITQGISSPGGISVDKRGAVYVANETGTVTIYPPGSNTPSLTLSAGLSSPQSIALDASGNVYVCDRGSDNSIVVFPPGSSTPSAIIKNDLVQVPTQIQFDSLGDLYYSDSWTGVSEIPAGSQEMISLGLRKLERTDGLALNPSSGNLFVGTFGEELDGVRVYVPDYNEPVRTLRDSAGSDLYASGTLNKSEYVFIPDTYDDTVKAFKASARTPAFVVNAEAAQYSVGVGIKAAGVP